MPYQVTRVWADGRTMDYGNKFNKVGAKDALTASLNGDERPFSKAETAYAKQIDKMQVGEERKIYPVEEECGDFFVVKFIVPGVKRARDSPAEELEDEPLEEKRSKFEISPVAWRNVPSGYVGPLACIVAHSTEMVAAFKIKRAEVLREYVAHEKTIAQNKGIGDMGQFAILARKIIDSEMLYFRDVREFVRDMHTGNLGKDINLDEICRRTYLPRDDVHVFVLEEAISILFNLGDFEPDDLRWICDIMAALKRASESYELNRFEAEFNSLSAACLLDARVLERLPDVLDMLPSVDFLWNALPIGEPFTEPKLTVLIELMQRKEMSLDEFVNLLNDKEYTEEHLEYFVFRGDEYDYAKNYDSMMKFYEQFENREEQRRWLQKKVERFPDCAQELADFDAALNAVRV